MGSINDILAYGAQNLQDKQAQQEIAKQNSAALVAHTQAATEGQQAVTQGTQLQNRVSERELRDQDIMQRAMANTNGDPLAIKQYAVKNGISAPGYFGLQTHISTAQTAAAKLTQEQLANESAVNGQTGNILQAVNDAAPDQRPAAWANALPQLQKMQPGYQWGNEVPTDAQLKFHLGTHGFTGKLLDQAKIQGDLAAQAAKLPGEQADSKLKASNTEFALGAGNGLTPKEAYDRFQAQSLQMESHRHNLATEVNAEAQRQNDAKRIGFEGQRVGLEGQRVGIEKQKFDATLGSGLDANGTPLSPEAAKAAAGQDSNAVAIANYTQKPPAGRTTPMALALMKRVHAINPGYDETAFPGRNKTAMDFSAGGKSGQALTSADTALAHLASISKAGEALKNNDFPALNRLANAVGVQVGSDPKTTYDTIVSMVAPEISKAVVGAAGGEGERMGMAKNFSTNASPQQREQAIGAAARLLAERVNKSRHAYETTMGKPLGWDLSPSSKDVLQKYSGGAAAPVASAGGTQVKDPRGVVHTFPNAQAAANFRKAAGL